MKKITIFLINFICLSHQIIPANQNIMPDLDFRINLENSLTQKLFNATMKNDLETVKDTITKGIKINDRNEDGETPLIVAAKYGHADIVNMFIENNANINAKNKSGNTALILATKNGHIKTVSILIENKADINAINRDGWTPLMLAIKYGYIEIVRILIDAGAYINTRNNNDLTPLIIAAENGEIEIIDILIKNKADVSSKYFSKKSALMEAVNNEHIEIVRILLDYGADPDQQNYLSQTARKINSKLIDEAILANREQIIKEIEQFSRLVSNFHNYFTESANNAFITQLFKHKNRWKTSEELIQEINLTPTL